MDSKGSTSPLVPLHRNTTFIMFTTHVKGTFPRYRVVVTPLFSAGHVTVIKEKEFELLLVFIQSAMAAGGSYNAPSAEDTRAGFGKDTQMDGIVGGGNGGGSSGGVTGTPLFGDYKK